jgi:hypothetical protein
MSAFGAGTHVLYTKVLHEHNTVILAYRAGGFMEEIVTHVLDAKMQFLNLRKGFPTVAAPFTFAS